jgi:type IV pilus assembly protein PilO
MSLRDPKTQKLVLTLALCTVALWSFFLTDLLPFGYQRLSKRKTELRAQYETVSGELEKARRTVGNLPELERENAALETKWKQAETLLPSDREVAELLTQITQAGEQSGVTFELFKPDEPKPQEFYNENPVEIKVRGGFHQVGMFLARLANLSRIVNVAQLKLEALDPSRDAKKKSALGDSDHTDQTLRASFTATAYSLRDVLPAQQQAPPAEHPGGESAGVGAGTMRRITDRLPKLGGVQPRQSGQAALQGTGDR